MELIVIKPTDMTQPRPRPFDGDLAALVASIIESPAEQVPGFDTISERGTIRKCKAFCHMDAKQKRLQLNSTATGLWHVALKRQGLERGLRRSDGTVADWLAGDVVVVIAEA